MPEQDTTANPVERLDPALQVVYDRLSERFPNVEVVITGHQIKVRMPSKGDRGPRIHFVWPSEASPGRVHSACWNADIAWLIGVNETFDPSEVTCGSGMRTRAWKEAMAAKENV